MGCLLLSAEYISIFVALWERALGVPSGPAWRSSSPAGATAGNWHTQPSEEQEEAHCLDKGESICV